MLNNNADQLLWKEDTNLVLSSLQTILEALTNTVYPTESLVLGNIQQGTISLHLELFP